MAEHEVSSGVPPMGLP